MCRPLSLSNTIAVLVVVVVASLLPSFVHSQQQQQQQHSNNNNNNLRGGGRRLRSPPLSPILPPPSPTRHRILGQKEPCTLLQRDRQTFFDDENTVSSATNSRDRDRYEDWYCELRGKDRTNYDKHFVRVHGLDEAVLQGKPSGHTTLYAADAEIMNGSLFVLPEKGDDGTGSGSGSGNNKDPEDGDGDGDGDEKSSVDNVDEENIDQLWELIFGSPPPEDEDGDGDGDGEDTKDASGLEDSVVGGDNTDPDEINSTPIDQVNDPDADGNDIDDLTNTEDLDDDTNDGIDESENALGAAGDGGANTMNIDDVEPKTGSDGFTLASYSSGTEQDENNVFDHDPNTESRRRRALEPDTGENVTIAVQTVLVVRVVANDTRTSLSRPQLSNAIFGTDGNNMVYLKERFNKCSYGQLQMEPFNGTTTMGNIVTSDHRDKAGVINVRIYENVTGQDPDDVMEAVLAAAELRVGDLEGQFDHVMLCLPPGTSGNWKSFGFVHHWLTVFNDDWCASPSAQVHEIGHNLGLGPSIEDYQGTRDQTGMMGTSYRAQEFPRMCFSPTRSWQLGWYPGKRLEMHHADLAQLKNNNKNPTTATGSNTMTVRLIGVDDYGQSMQEGDDSHRVLVKIHAGDTKYYLGFNRKKGINEDVIDAPNLVTVQAQVGKHHDPTERIAVLGANETYSVQYQQGQGQQQQEDSELTIRVTEINMNGDRDDAIERGVAYAEIEISVT